MDFDFHVQNPYVPGGGEWQYAPPPFFYTNPNAMMGNPMADWFDEQMGYANSYGTIPVWQDRVCTEWQDLVHYMNRKVSLVI